MRTDTSEEFTFTGIGGARQHVHTRRYKFASPYEPRELLKLKRAALALLDGEMRDCAAVKVYRFGNDPSRGAGQRYVGEFVRASAR